MPTLECLDERSRLILERLNEIDERFVKGLGEVKFCVEERNRLLESRIESIENDIIQIKLQHAEENGKKSVFVWVGGIALTALASILGAVGNAVYSWIIRPPPGMH
jgi:hypothetical protein